MRFHRPLGSGSSGFHAGRGGMGMQPTSVSSSSLGTGSTGLDARASLAAAPAAGCSSGWSTMASRAKSYLSRRLASWPFGSVSSFAKSLRAPPSSRHACSVFRQPMAMISARPAAARALGSSSVSDIFFATWHSETMASKAGSPSFSRNFVTALARGGALPERFAAHDKSCTAMKRTSFAPASAGRFGAASGSHDESRNMEWCCSACSPDVATARSSSESSSESTMWSHFL
mmetsp:Transcript_40164/g.106280  ORF Transcript_40164/g.106280 Transcript_40164/m.106280 type:complete len:231 (+) Transcript_40164:474-1166(+)